MILNPRVVFRNAKDGKYGPEAMAISAVAAGIVLSKALLLTREAAPFLTFWDDANLNALFTWLGHPVIAVALAYAMHALFIGVVYASAKMLSSGPVKLKPLVIAMCAIAVLGIVAHVIFWTLRLAVPKQIAIVFIFAMYTWAIVLSVMAISITQRLGAMRSIVCVLGDSSIFNLSLKLRTKLENAALKGINSCLL